MGRKLLIVASKRYGDYVKEIAESMGCFEEISFVDNDREGAIGKLEDVDLVVALPEQEEWTISTEEGTTTANAMSSFAMKTADGRELSFLKDNCPIEDGALSEDSGDSIWVTYVTSEGMNFPVEIVKGQ